MGDFEGTFYHHVTQSFDIASLAPRKIEDMDL